MDPSRFTQDAAETLVRALHDRSEYWSFVPHPLPPPLAMDLSLVRTLSDADRALGELAGLGRQLPNPHLLIRPFLRREAVLSSRIEGTQASVADLYAFEARQLQLPGLDTGASAADVREVNNYVQAMEYGLERLESLPISLRFIRELHERLMDGVRGEHATPGEFRRTPNWIGAPGCTLNEASFVPPPVAEMHRALDLFERYLHAEDPYPPLIRLAFIHHQFESIHPFLDGNGRIGRLLVSLLLVHWELLPLPLLYLSAFFERHRDTYYDLLQAVSERGAWSDWVSFFLQGVAEQSRDAVDRAKRLQDLQQRWRIQIGRSRVSPLVLRLVDHLFENPFTSIPLAQELLGAGSYHTAQSAVERLLREGILRQVGSGRPLRVFVAGDVLDIISGLGGT